MPVSSNAAPAVAPEVVSKVGEVVSSAWKRMLLTSRRGATPHPNYVYASGWRVCERRMVLEITVPEKQAPFDEFALARFKRGNDRERDILLDLTRAGQYSDPPFAVVGQQDSFRLRDRKGRQVISGKVDAFLEFVDELGTRRRAPIEVKSWHPNVVERIDSFDDVFESPWTRSGGYQLLSYLYGHGHPLGFLVLDQGGIPKLLPVVLEHHLDRVEEFLQRAERVVDHALAETLPPFLQGDETECKRCPFYGIGCNPDLTATNVDVFTDEALELDLQRWNELQAAGKEWQGLDKRIKAKLRGVEHGVCGEFSIIGRWGKSSRLELPDDVKAKYTVNDPKGRFFLEIVKAPAATPEGAAR